MKTTTVTREYDEQGRMVRETRVEVERPDVTVDEGYWWKPQPGWWQYPVISYTAPSSSTSQILVT